LFSSEKACGESFRSSLPAVIRTNFISTIKHELLINLLISITKIDNCYQWHQTYCKSGNKKYVAKQKKVINVKQMPIEVTTVTKPKL
jgi:hypothetical protein